MKIFRFIFFFLLVICIKYMNIFFLFYHHFPNLDQLNHLISFVNSTEYLLIFISHRQYFDGQICIRHSKRADIQTNFIVVSNFTIAIQESWNMWRFSDVICSFDILSNVCTLYYSKCINIMQCKLFLVLE